LYWSLPPSVFCQRFRQIKVLRGHSLISLLFSLVEEYGSRMNLEILILHFGNKNYFDVSPITICFWNLATPWLFSFLEKRLFTLVFGNEVFGENMSWDDLLFRSEGLEKKLQVLYEKKLVSFFEHLFLSAWIIMSSLFLISWILWKKYTLHFESIVYCSRLLACLIRKDFYRHIT